MNTQTNAAEINMTLPQIMTEVEALSIPGTRVHLSGTGQLYVTGCDFDAVKAVRNTVRAWLLANVKGRRLTYVKHKGNFFWRLDDDYTFRGGMEIALTEVEQESALLGHDRAMLAACIACGNCA